MASLGGDWPAQFHAASGTPRPLTSAAVSVPRRDLGRVDVVLSFASMVLGVLGVAPAPAVRAVNLLLLFSAGLLAIGFLQLRQTIASRVG